MSLSRREDADLTGDSSRTETGRRAADGWERNTADREGFRGSLTVSSFPGENANTECPKDKKVSLKKASSNADVWGRSGDPSCFFMD